MLKPMKSISIEKRVEQQQPEYSCQKRGVNQWPAMNVVDRTYPYCPVMICHSKQRDEKNSHLSTP
jgi:hypothetical protein